MHEKKGNTNNPHEQAPQDMSIVLVPIVVASHQPH
jgi:hypothetical protein